MKMWSYIKKSVVFLGDGSALVAGIGVCIMGLILTGNTIARYVFNSPWPFGEEYTAYILVMLTFFPLAYTLRKKGHIRIELIVDRFSVKTRRWVVIVTTIISLIVVSIMIVYGLELAIKSYQYNIRATTVMMTPLWIPQMFIVVGLIIFGLQLMLYFISRIRKLREEYPSKLSSGL